MATTIDRLDALGYQVGCARESGDDASPWTFVVSGPGISGLNVRIDPQTREGYEQADRELLDSLADPVARCEREFQNDRPDAHLARAELVAKGYDVERPDPTVDRFVVTGNDAKPLTGLGPDALVAANEKLQEAG